VTWDITRFKEKHGTIVIVDDDDNDVDFYYFDKPVNESDGTGGGVLKFGIIVGTDNVIQQTKAAIYFEDVRFYVYDVDLFFEFVDEVLAISEGEVSEELRAKVFAAE